MRGIKIPQQDFALKMPEGLMREGGRICGTLQYLPQGIINNQLKWLCVWQISNCGPVAATFKKTSLFIDHVWVCGICRCP